MNSQVGEKNKQAS